MINACLCVCCLFNIYKQFILIRKMGILEQQHSSTNASTDPFLVNYKNRTYDITHFIKNHPGGLNTLQGLNNGDMTKRFLHAPPHSDAAMYLMKEYEIKAAKGSKFKNRIKATMNEADVFERNNNELDDSMEHLVDWSKAMVPQIPRIVKHYNEWVHKPVDRPLRLFSQWYLEMCTKTPWWVVPVFWIPVITTFIWNEFAPKWQASNSGTNEFTFMLIMFVMGILFWTLLEYVLHRFVFHVQINENTNAWLCTFHFMIHGLHHKVPFDSMRLVFPPLPGVVIASIIYAPLSFFLPYPRVLLSGALFGYLCYDMMHYYLHYGSPSATYTRFMYNMKRYHYQHHFAHQQQGYGISSPFWDIIFDTRIQLRKLRFQLRWK